MNMLIKPVNNFKGIIKVPGDKSISHRALMIGAISRGKTRIFGLHRGGDCQKTRECLEKMGAVAKDKGAEIIIEGKGLRGFREAEGVLDAGNSATTMRLLLGIFAGQPFTTFIDGDASLRLRPMARVIRPLQEMGAKILARRKDARAPVAVFGGDLSPLDYEIPMASAQVKSSLLLAGCYAEGTTFLHEKAPTRNHTEIMMESFGASVKRQGMTVSMEGWPNLQAREVHIPKDISAAAFFLAAGAMFPGAEVAIEGVGINPTRIGFLKALEKMGADIKIENRRTLSGEKTADLTLTGKELKGIDINGQEVPSMIDEIPILAAVASVAQGTTRIEDAQELRFKETDRIRAVAVELRKLGGSIEEKQSGLVVHGNTTLQGGICSARGDHRMAMALAVAGLRARQETTVQGVECIEVSFPGFIEEFTRTAFGSKVTA